MNNVRLYPAIATVLATTTLASADGPEGVFEVEGRVMDSCLNDISAPWGTTLSRDGRRLFYADNSVGGRAEMWVAELDDAGGGFADCRPLTEINSGIWDPYVYAIAIDPFSSDTVYAGNGLGVLKTTTGGQ